MTADITTLAKRLHEAYEGSEQEADAILENIRKTYGRDTAVAVRYADGSFTLEGEPYVSADNIGGRGLASFLARLALSAPPMTSAAVGFILRSTGSADGGAATRRTTATISTAAR
jgi:hypothetical protein